MADPERQDVKRAQINQQVMHLDKVEAISFEIASEKTGPQNGRESIFWLA